MPLSRFSRYPTLLYAIARGRFLRVGETVVLVKDVEGVQADKETPVMSMRESENAILLGYRRQERLELVLVRTWRSCLRKCIKRLLKKIGPSNERDK